MIDETKGIEMFDVWIVGSGREGNNQVIEYLMFKGHVVDSISRISKIVSFWCYGLKNDNFW